MLRAFCAIFSLFIAAAGWYYMFYSRAASRLSGIEDPSANKVRVWLRRANGLMMFLLAICFFSGFFAVDLDHPTKMTAIVWLAVCGLVLALLALGLVDLRLTWRLRSTQRPEFPIDKRS
ncbi:MAG TPA: hypothetical protein VGQ99_14880 [Tepidisphaeraceae bacterium]|jgi:hypothetical protein|nr:hypothetical protein [Tepidisphaeraceae bacterium]